jgi:hypothetical protein
MRKRHITFTSVFVALACFGVLPQMHAIAPTPDGCYPNYTTAEGCNALKSLTTGAGNTGAGWYSLYINTTGSFNTGVGGGALALNNADSNTAVGAAALLLNTSGMENVAVGTDALVFNDSGSHNSAVGAFALFSNTSGFQNTATGYQALQQNTAGGENTADGFQALAHSLGGANTAVGSSTLSNNTTGVENTAVGVGALGANQTGNVNTAIGFQALLSNTGTANIAVGFQAGENLTTGSNNIDIGNHGLAGESTTIRIGDPDTFPGTVTYIAGISGQTASGGVPVYVNTNGKLGTLLSSERFKDEIKSMNKASEAIFALKPVTFRYKKELDPARTSQFGLVAEEVEKVNPDLVVCDKEGQPYTVRYEAVNAMLLNEFIKEHRKMLEQEATIGELKKEMQRLIAHSKEQDAQIRKVSTQVEMSRPAQEVARTQ